MVSLFPQTETAGRQAPAHRLGEHLHERAARPGYAEGHVYMALERMATSAGVRIVYAQIDRDGIDGYVDRHGGRWVVAMSPHEAPTDERGALLLAHELGHVLTGTKSARHEPQHRFNEALATVAGVRLYRLAAMQAHEAGEIDATQLMRAFTEGGPRYEDVTVGFGRTKGDSD